MLFAVVFGSAVVCGVVTWICYVLIHREFPGGWWALGMRCVIATHSDIGSTISPVLLLVVSYKTYLEGRRKAPETSESVELLAPGGELRYVSISSGV